MTTLGRWLRGFGAFWWDFIVGDDWRVAAGVVAALAATAGIAAAGIPAWWFLPTAVLGLLAASVLSGVRRTPPTSPVRGDDDGRDQTAAIPPTRPAC